MELVLASNNAKKIRELRELLAPYPVAVLSQREAGLALDPEETGKTFEENAFIKANAVFSADGGRMTLADDSGLMVDALGGAPGVLSARYTGRHDDSDEDRWQLLLKNMEGIKNRQAKFVCCICCLLPDGRRIETRGECPGSILEAPRGTGGFGYDPVFLPEGKTVSMAELSAEEKNEISHRGKALREFVKRIEVYLHATDK
jgi:XTP/dITP diphosphohydrolase